MSSEEDVRPSFGGQLKNRRSKNSQIYGIFGDDEDDRNTQKKRTRAAPMMFVKSKTSTSQEEEKIAPKKDPRAMKMKKKPVKMDRNFGKWESSTKGFGMKMLMKMGFKGRLGKYEQGTTVPIAVKERRKNAGLGADGHEAVHLKQNKEFEREFYDREAAEIEETTKTEENYEIAKEWKRKRVKTKRTFMTASEFLKEQNNTVTAKPTQVIVDARGPVERTLNSMSELKNKKTANLFEGLGKHILYNTEQLVVQAEEDLLRIHRDLRSTRENVTALQNEIELLEKHNETFDAATRYDRIQKKLVDISSRSRKLSPHELCKSLREIRDLDIKVWINLDLIRVARELATMSLRSAIIDWNPLRDGAELIVNLLKPWRVFLFETSSQIYDEIVESISAGKLRKSITNEWNVQDASSLIALIGDLRQVVSSSLLESLMQDVVLPKLVRSLNDWNPKEDDVNIHVWVHPWLHPLLLGHNNPTLCALWPVVTRRIKTMLKSWLPEQTLAHDILLPWSRVLSVKQTKEIMRSRILPTLAKFLRNLSHENSTTHTIDTSALEYTLRWSDMLSNTQLLVFLEGEFFPRWLHALGSRVLLLEKEEEKKKKNFSSIESWYRKWRAMFSSSLLNSEPRFLHPFQYALSMISAAVFEDFDEVRRLHDAIPLDVTYTSIANRKHRRVQAASERSLRKESAARESARRAKRDAEKITFRDVVEMFASENGVSFLPNTKRGRIDGKQIYNFDDLFVYIDNEVLYVHRGASQWDPVDLQNLLSAVKSSS